MLEDTDNVFVITAKVNGFRVWFKKLKRVRLYKVLKVTQTLTLSQYPERKVELFMQCLINGLSMKGTSTFSFLSKIIMDLQE